MKADKLNPKEENVWFLAHADDELFALPLFWLPGRHSIYYLSCDQDSKSVLNSRESELSKVILRLGKFVEVKYLSLGKHWKIFDSKVPESISDEFMDYIYALNPLFSSGRVRIISTAYEGAHQDHDAAACVSKLVSNKFGLDLIHFATYPMHPRIPVFSIMRLGKDCKNTFTVRKYTSFFLAIQLIKIYKSQSKTWIGLGPFLLFNYAFKKFRVIINPNIDLHLNRVFYEFRGRAIHNRVIEDIQKWYP